MKEESVIFSYPADSYITLFSGSVRVKPTPVIPLTVKLAAEIVPAMLGNVAPPVWDLVPSKATTTVPKEALAMMFPKARSPTLVIPMGVIMVALEAACAEAVGLVCALTLTVAKETRTRAAKMFFRVFIVLDFLGYIFLFLFLGLLPNKIQHACQKM